MIKNSLAIPRSNAIEYEFLKVIRFKDLGPWDVKRYVEVSFGSPFEVVPLKKHINEQKLKIKPGEYPGKQFKLLGVNNKEGLFDAYIKEGSSLRQPYKKVKDGFLVFNPYRVNVGSVGVKTGKQYHEYISSAYVVLSCREMLMPGFLFLLFKTDRFNKLVRSKTSGSVRQSLSFGLLAEMKIPLPDTEFQEQLVRSYDELQALAERDESKAQALEQEIEEFLSRELEISVNTTKTREGLQFIRFKSLSRWSVGYCLGWENNNKGVESAKYPQVEFGDLVESARYGISEKASEQDIGIPILRMNNIRDSNLVFNDLKFMPVEFNNPVYLLKKGDLLFNRTNSKELVGKTAVFAREGVYTYASYLIRVRLKEERADVYFINYLFNSRVMRRQIDRLSRKNLGQANINIEELKGLRVPLPPLHVQRRIVLKIRSLKIQVMHLRKSAELLRNRAIEMVESELFCQDSSHDQLKVLNPDNAFPQLGKIIS